MLSLVTIQLKAGKLKQAVSDVATVLQLMESAPLNAAWDTLWQQHIAINERSEHTVTALQLVCYLAEAGACDKSEAVRLCLQLLRIVKPDGIPNDQVAEELAQAAAQLESADIDSSLVDLVTACGPRQTQHCLQLVAATRAHQERQQRLYSALMTALGFHVQGGRQPAALSGSELLAYAKALLSGPAPGEHLTNGISGPCLK
jgi:hypothetical protein